MKNWFKENRYVIWITFIFAMCFMRMWTFKGVEVSFISVSKAPVEYSISYDSKSGFVYEKGQFKSGNKKQEVKKYVSAGVHTVRMKVPTKRMKHLELNFDNPNVSIGQLRIKGRTEKFFEKIDNFKLFMQEIKAPHFLDKQIIQYSLEVPNYFDIEAIRMIHFEKLFLIIFFIGCLIYFFKQMFPYHFTKKEFLHIFFLTLLLAMCSSFLYFKTSLFHVFLLSTYNRGVNINISSDNKSENSKFSLVSIKNGDEIHYYDESQLYSKMNFTSFLGQKNDILNMILRPKLDGMMSLQISSYRGFPILIKNIEISDQNYMNTKKETFLTVEDKKNHFKVFADKPIHIKIEVEKILLSISDIKLLTGFSRLGFLFTLFVCLMCSFYIIRKSKKISIMNAFFLSFGIAIFLMLIFWFLKGIFTLDHVPNFLYDFISELWSAEQPYHLKSKLSEYPPFIVLLYRFFSTKANFLGEVNVDVQVKALSQLFHTGSLMIFIFWQMLTMFFMLLFLLSRFQNFSYNKFCLIFLIFLINIPILFAFKSGNQIILCTLFLSYYLFHYNDTNQLKKELAFICLAVAVGIKIYPVFFGLLTLNQKNKKDIVHLMLYGFFLFFLPFLAFSGGFENIKLLFIDGQQSWHNQFSCLYSFRGLTKGYWDEENMPILTHLFGRNVSNYCDNIFNIINFICVFIGAVMFPFVKSQWKKWAFIALTIVVLLPKTFPYSIVIMLPAIVSFLKEEKRVTYKNIYYLLSLVVLFYPNIFIHRNLSTSLVGNTLFIFLTVDFLVNFIQIHKKKIEN